MGEHQGYPVILGGDHAAFELEHAGMDPKARPDWPLPSFDAKDWAEAFCKIFKVTKRGEPLALDADDHDLMVTWFANALMRGYDEHTAEAELLIHELLAALKAMHDHAVEYARINNLFNSDGSPATFHELLQARAAIAKAEGR